MQAEAIAGEAMGEPAADEGLADGIAGPVSEGVVGDLEVVQIHVQDGGPSCVVAAHQVRTALFEVSSVCQAGQWVVQRGVTEHVG
ncbi:hypothetical protein ABIB14_003511 [Arthrobacter sp. UYEF3]